MQPFWQGIHGMIFYLLMRTPKFEMLFWNSRELIAKFLTRSNPFGGHQLKQSTGSTILMPVIQVLVVTW